VSGFPGYNKVTRPHGAAQWHILWSEEKTACGRRAKPSHEFDACDDAMWETSCNKCSKCHERWLKLRERSNL